MTLRAANDELWRSIRVGRLNPSPGIFFGATQRLIAGPPGPERGTSGRAGQRCGAARLRAALIPVKKVLTPQITPTSAWSTRRHQGLVAADGERLSGREPPPRSCEHGGWRRRSSVRAELRVYGRRPHKRRIHPPIPPTPPIRGEPSHHTLSHSWTSGTTIRTLISTGCTRVG